MTVMPGRSGSIESAVGSERRKAFRAIVSRGQRRFAQDDAHRHLPCGQPLARTGPVTPGDAGARARAPSGTLTTFPPRLRRCGVNPGNKRKIVRQTVQTWWTAGSIDGVSRSGRFDHAGDAKSDDASAGRWTPSGVATVFSGRAGTHESGGTAVPCGLVSHPLSHTHPPVADGEPARAGVSPRYAGKPSEVAAAAGSSLRLDASRAPCGVMPVSGGSR
jgi:hypothetical protein